VAGNIGVLNEERTLMESRNQVVALCGSFLYSNHSKLGDITAGKLSVKSQLITQNSMSSEWHQSSTCGFQRVSKKLQKSRPAIFQGNTVCRMKVYWTSNSFLVKS